MLSTRLVQLVEKRWEDIASGLILTIRHHPEMRELAKRSDLELRDWCRDILSNLNSLLLAGTEDAVQNRFQLMGRLRFEEGVPLHEAVLRLHLLRGKVTEFIREEGLPTNAIQLYSEEELQYRLSKFFDACVYHLVRGYEAGIRVAQRLAS